MRSGRTLASNWPVTVLPAALLPAANRDGREADRGGGAQGNERGREGREGRGGCGNALPAVTKGGQGRSARVGGGGWWPIEQGEGEMEGRRREEGGRAAAVLSAAGCRQRWQQGRVSTGKKGRVV